jgi:uncharacterized delta-60 repeat protein
MRLTLILIVSLSLNLYASINQKAFGGNDEDVAYSVTSTYDGNFAVVGSCESFSDNRSDICLVKMEPSGKLLWRKVFGGEKDENGYDVIETKDRGLLVVGSSRSYSKRGNNSVYITKLNQNGKLLWDRVIGGNKHDIANSVDEFANGDLLIAGSTQSFGKGREDGYLIKLTSKGDTIWTKAIGSSAKDTINDIKILKNQDFIVAGSTKSYGNGNDDIYIVKFTKDGKQIFAKAIGEKNSDVGYAVEETLDGGCVVVGKIKSYDSKREDIIAIRLNKNGLIMWNRLFGSKKQDIAYDVLALNSGNFIISATTKSFGKGGYDTYLLKLNKMGKILWADTFGADDDEKSYALTKLKDNSIVAVGETSSYGAGKEDFYIIRIK